MEIDRHFAEVLSAFMTNGVHGETWPNVSYMVARYTRDGQTRYFRAQNAFGRHAEDAVIKHFKDMMTAKTLDSQRIKLYLSNSPCRECSRKLIALMNTARWNQQLDLQVELVFSAFYRIRRPSCARKSVCSQHLPSKEDHRSQVEALKELHRMPGVDLRTIDHRDWLDLQIALGRRPEEDEMLRKDFEEVMGLVSSCGEKAADLRDITTENQEQSRTCTGSVKDVQNEQETRNSMTSPIQKMSRSVSQPENIGLASNNETTQDLSSYPSADGMISNSREKRCKGSTATPVTSGRQQKKGSTCEVTDGVQAENTVMTVNEDIVNAAIEEKILEIEIELVELKLKAAKKKQEMECLTSKADYSTLKHLKLYYEVRQMERNLGVPAELGVNTIVTAKVPFKLKD